MQNYDRASKSSTVFPTKFQLTSAAIFHIEMQCKTDRMYFRHAIEYSSTASNFPHVLMFTPRSPIYR